MNTARVVAELVDTDAGRRLLGVDELGGQVDTDQAAGATGFPPRYVHQLTRRLSRYGVVRRDQQSLAEAVGLSPLACEVAAHLR
ncbi:hypothetical protein [Kocuria sp. U4B]